MTLGAGPGFRMDDAAPDNGASPGADDTDGGQIPLSGHSRFIQRLRRRYPEELALLPSGVPTPATLASTYEALRSRGFDTGATLRVLRQLVLERLAVLDCDEQAPLSTITLAVTELAEFALDVACTEACARLDADHGAPLTAGGARAQASVQATSRANSASSVTALSLIHI